MTRDEINDLLNQMAEKRSTKVRPELKDSFKVGYFRGHLAEIIKNDPKLIDEFKFYMALDF